MELAVSSKPELEADLWSSKSEVYRRLMRIEEDPVGRLSIIDALLQRTGMDAEREKLLYEKYTIYKEA